MTKFFLFSAVITSVATLSFSPIQAQKPGPGKGSLTYVKRGTEGDATYLRSVIESDKLFVVSQSKGVYTLKVHNGDSLTQISNNSAEVGLLTGGIAKNGDFLYITDNLNGILVFDTRGEKLEKLFSFKPVTEVWDVAVKGDILYAAEASAGLTSYQLNPDGSFTKLSNYKTVSRWSWAWRTQIVNDTLFVVDKEEGIKVFDISTPASPRYLSSFKTGGTPKDIIKSGSRLLVADGPEGLKVFTLNSAGFARLIESVPTRGDAQSILQSGKYFFLASGTDGIYILSYSATGSLTADFRTKEEGEIISITKLNENVFASSSEGILLYKYNSPPIIESISNQVVDENALLTFTRKGFDPDGSKVIISAENLPEGAEWNIEQGTFTWTPTYEQSGRYRIYFAITEDTDAALYDVDTVTVVVNHVNRSPSLALVEPVTIPENKPFELVISSGTDPDREDEGKLVHFARQMPQGAAFDPATLKFSWTPTYEQSGNYPVQFGVKDPAGLEAVVTFNVTVTHVNRPPVLAEIGPKTVNENEGLPFIVKWSDPDKEDDGKLRMSTTALPEGASFDLASGSFNWTPTFEQSGTYTIRFTVEDSDSDGAGIQSDSEEITITVNHVNRAPVLYLVKDQSTKENELLEFRLTGADPDVEDLGKLVFSGKDLPKGSELKDSTFIWTPDFFQAGTYTVNFKISDPSGLTAAQDMKMTVENVNRNPVIEPVNAVLDAKENSLFTYQFRITDPDKEKLTLTLLPLPAGATFDAEKQLFTWTPTYEQSGTYDLTLAAKDPLDGTDQVTFAISVANVNRFPVFADIPSQLVAENKPLMLTVTATDPDRQQVTLDITGLVQGMDFNVMTGSLNWTPDFEQAGSYTVTVTATDEEGAKTDKQVQITVSNVNRLPEFTPVEPVSVNENEALRLVIVAQDPDRQVLTYSSQDLPQGARLGSQDGVLEWTPTFEQAGPYTIQVKATDPEGGFSVLPVSVSVQNINRNPVLSDVKDISGDENQRISVTFKAADPDRQALTIRLDGELPAGATFDVKTLVFTWTPGYTQAGNYGPLTLTAVDPEGAQAEATFNLTVKNINRKPVLAVNGTRTVMAGEAIRLTATASDQDEETLSLGVKNNPAGSGFNPANGEFSWDSTLPGTYTIDFTVNDGIDTVTESVTITVNPKPVAPQGGGN